MTLSDNLGQSKSQTISTGSVQLVATGWAKGSTTVKVYFTRGWNLGVDDIRYSSVTTTSPQMLSAEPSSLFFASLKRRTIEENSRSTISTTGPTGSDQPETSAQDLPRKVLLASVIESPRLRTNLGINSLSNSLATVNQLIRQTRDPLGAKTLQVSPLGSQQVNHVVQFLYPGFTGELKGLDLEGDNHFAWSFRSRIRRGSKLFFRPSLSFTQNSIVSAAELSPSESSLSVLNAGSAVAQVSITAYDVSGLAIGQTETAIPLLPKATLELNNVLSALGVKDPVGPLEITSLNDVPLLAVSRVSTPEHFGGTLEGLSPSNASTALVVPAVADNAGVGTSLDIKNVTDRAAQVIIRFRVQDGSELGFLQVTVPPKGFTALVDVVRQLVQAPGASGLEGSVELESDEPILAWASQIDHLTQDPAFIQGRKQGSNKLLVPSAINVGTFRSSLTVTNTGNGGICRRSLSGRRRRNSRSAKKHIYSCQGLFQLGGHPGEFGNSSGFRQHRNYFHQWATSGWDLSYS